MIDVRNPEYARGMTMRELVVMSEGPMCHWCGRTPILKQIPGGTNEEWRWEDGDHDGMCPVPFMRAAQEKLDGVKE